MTDIEVKRKELETAKRIRGNGYTCQGANPYISCFDDECPSRKRGDLCSFSGKPADWDAFISTREAELAEPENTPQDGLSHVQTAPDDPLEKMLAKWRGGAIPAGDPSFRFTDRIPTIDDFALALIQGGYYCPNDEKNPEASLYHFAERLKAESDRRRA